MKNTFKQLLSFILPVTTTILIPLYIEKNFRLQSILTSAIGIILMLLGLFILILTISTFIRTGKGTLAPWSPAKNLITAGIYGYVRNPMIMGVCAILLGESITFLSLNIFIWAVIFFLINNIYFTVFEEPGLEKRFGEDYNHYKKNVPRWIPGFKKYKRELK